MEGTVPAFSGSHDLNVSFSNTSLLERRFPSLQQYLQRTRKVFVVYLHFDLLSLANKGKEAQEGWSCRGFCFLSLQTAFYSLTLFFSLVTSISKTTVWQCSTFTFPDIGFSNTLHDSGVEDTANRKHMGRSQ